MSSTSKISREALHKSVDELLSYSHNKRKRNFIETIELQIILKNYNTLREKRFCGSIRLPYTIRPRHKICLYGDEEHCNEARTNNIPCMTTEDLKRLNKDKKKKRNLEHRYHTFLASETIIRLIPRLLGPGLGKAGKFPTLITHNETLAGKVQQIKSTLRVQLKKHANINVAIGHVNMTIEQVMINTNMSINFIIQLLRKKWANIEKIFIKSTMGKCHRLY
ncbi:unnamed protein product [Adineta steineri]|uniref:Ribosomal protein n=1 Tax=Adineta steineri TaxID=433720 RepID=A0A813RG43_9BILA|nr:unnamed protein product [Adineta steineri]CAF0780466.1 unnamed protein product [Adineta steineri]CAF1072124.1 unnamed protein product [Adineta steineri]